MNNLSQVLKRDNYKSYIIKKHWECFKIPEKNVLFCSVLNHAGSWRCWLTSLGQQWVQSSPEKSLARMEQEEHTKNLSSTCWSGCCPLCWEGMVFQTFEQKHKHRGWALAKKSIQEAPQSHLQFLSGPEAKKKSFPLILLGVNFKKYKYTFTNVMQISSHYLRH